MNVKKLITLLLAVMMVLAMAACGAKENDKKTDIPGGNTMTDEPKTLEPLPCSIAFWRRKTPSSAKTPPCGKRYLWPPIRI